VVYENAVQVRAGKCFLLSSVCVRRTAKTVTGVWLDSSVHKCLSVHMASVLPVTTEGRKEEKEMQWQSLRTLHT
jgi:hypothetical protein